MKELIGSYKNGNYKVFRFSDGTMIRHTNESEYISEFPDSMDIKITNRCTGTNCQYCHENSNSCGNHGEILSVPFLNSLHPYTELAIGGGNVLEHPDFIQFLKWCKEKNIFANITLNQKHFVENIDTVRYLAENKLIYGLGISLVSVTTDFIKLVKEFDNAVIHVIAGIVTKDEMECLYKKDLKLLILGYKQFRRGKDYYALHQSSTDLNRNWLKNNIGNIITKFNTVSFDNLAIKQLEIKSLVTGDSWDNFYMGDDGTHTMYVDTVNKEYAVSSTSTVRHGYNNEKIEDMFKVIKEDSINV
ncbi:MAG: radical SAM protein [Methanobrevibacter sp.]|nr:radical SAM protein [Methanobrevibacter sp.]MBO7692777.1 radical SAM protein [Methanobrevibacter sp.]